MNSGFIVLWRKFLDTAFYKDSFAVHLAIHLIMQANHESKKFTFNRKEEILERGQLLTGRKALSSQTGISESTITHKLALFENIGFLTRKTNNKFSILTICNYNRYQDKKSKVEQRGIQQGIQPSNTNNNVTIKQYNKEAIPPADFLTFLKTNIAYSHINIEIELAKMDAWLSAHPGRQKTKKFIINWLNKIEKPIGVGKPSIIVAY